MDRQQELSLSIQEFTSDAEKVADAGREALQHLAEGDEQAACNRIAISHYPLGHLSGEYDGILDLFRSQGVEPGGAFGSNTPDQSS